MSDTVTVPRWALQHVLDFAMQDRHVPDIENTLANFASAHNALLRALDAKTEKDDEKRSEVDKPKEAQAVHR